MAKPILFLFCFVGTLTAVSSAGIGGNLVTFPYADNPCSCVLLTCTCCTGIKVAQVGFSKTLCVVVSVKILTLSFDVTIKLDTKTLSSFTFSALTPPTYCIPIVLPINVSMCLKVHDVSLLSLTSVQLCMTIYGAYNNKNVAVIPLNCIRLSSGSLQYVVTSSTTTTTTTAKPTTTTAKTTTTTTTAKTTAPTTTTTATTTAKTTAPTTTTTTTTTAATGKGNRAENRDLESRG